MSRQAATFESQRAQAVIAAIFALMSEREYVTPRDIAVATGMSTANASTYLNSLSDRNLVVCIQRSILHKGGSNPSRWKRANGADMHVAPHDPSIRHVVISTSWDSRKLPEMFEPMAYLFGRIL